MDIQKQVAARREELVRQQSEATALRQAQKRAALDATAQKLSNEDVKVERDGDHLTIVEKPLSAADVEELERWQILSLLANEARKRWTANENWLVIGCIVGGLCLMFFGGIGVVPLAFGLWRQSELKKKYTAELRTAYPEIFGLAEAPVTLPEKQKES